METPDIRFRQLCKKFFIPRSLKLRLMKVLAFTLKYISSPLEVRPTSVSITTPSFAYVELYFTTR